MSLQKLFDMITWSSFAYKCGQHLLQFDQNSSDYNISFISNHTLQSLVHSGGATLIGVASIFIMNNNKKLCTVS